MKSESNSQTDLAAISTVHSHCYFRRVWDMVYKTF